MSQHDYQMQICRKSIIRLTVILTLFCVAFFTSGCNSTGNELSSSNYEQKIKKDPSNCFLNEQLALAYQAEKKYLTAINQFDSTLKICPETPSLRFQFGVSCLLSGQKQKGFQEMERAIYLAEENNDIEYGNMLKLEMQEWKNNSSKIK